jgi:hypothetical protein
MHVECPGCGSRGPGLSAAGTRCPFCGGAYAIVGIQALPPGLTAATPQVIETMRREQRNAYEQYEQYRRSVFRTYNPSSIATTEALARFWTSRTDPDHDRLSARVTSITVSLNAALASLGIPPET